MNVVLGFGRGSGCDLFPITEEMSKYKILNSSHHRGNIFQHSIWTARYVEKVWRDPQTSGLGDSVFSDLLKGIPSGYKNFTLLAAFLHDLGKLDGEFDAEKHPQHMVLGYLLFKRCPGVELVLSKCTRKASSGGETGPYRGTETESFLAIISLFHLYLGDAMKGEVSPDEFAFKFVGACHKTGVSSEKIKVLMAILLLISLADVKGARPVEAVSNSSWKLLTTKIAIKENLPEKETPWFRYGYSNTRRVRKLLKEVRERTNSWSRILEFLTSLGIEGESPQVIFKFLE